MNHKVDLVNQMSAHTQMLALFARHPDASLRDLVAHSGRDKGQIARLTGGSRERGLLEATADTCDGRSIRLRLTGEGRSLQQSIPAQRKRLNKLAPDA